MIISVRIDSGAVRPGFENHRCLVVPHHGIPGHLYESLDQVPSAISVHVIIRLHIDAEPYNRRCFRVIRRPGLEINIANYDVRINGESIPFTPKEVEILYLLASNPGRVFDREHILSKVWGYDFFGDTRAVDTQIKRIRQKLPDEDLSWSIKTVYGVGYKFEVC